MTREEMISEYLAHYGPTHDRLRARDALRVMLEIAEKEGAADANEKMVEAMKELRKSL
jgi:hypothetical protein